MINAPDILQKIVRRKEQTVAEKKRILPLAQLQQQIAAASPVRGFVAAIQKKIAAGKIAVIAEIKRASPSKGVIRENYRPAEIAVSYQKNGAAALSVLTEVDFFQGADEHLQQARAACALPVLRKDFIIDAWQVYESRCLGADCILLIAAVLAERQLHEFAALAAGLQLDVLVEVHDEKELEVALGLDTPFIGINNRCLKTFTTRLETTFELAAKIPGHKIVVTESGIHSAADIKLFRQRQVNAFLIGETLMRAVDPGEKLAELIKEE